MKKSHFIKGIVLSLFVIGVETGNASFNQKCCKVAKQPKTNVAKKAAIAKHFMPLDMVRW
jgi:hypothetical protein